MRREILRACVSSTPLRPGGRNPEDFDLYPSMFTLRTMRAADGLVFRDLRHCSNDGQDMKNAVAQMGTFLTNIDQKVDQTANYGLEVKKGIFV